MMKKSVLALMVACLLTLAPLGPAMAVDTGLGAEVIVEAGLTVTTSLPTEYPVTKDATARGSGGESLTFTGGKLSVAVSQKKAKVTLPVALGAGQSLSSFSDPVTGIEVSGTSVKLPIQDIHGNETTMTIHADVEEIKTADGGIEVVATNVKLKSAEISVDLSDDDEAIGNAAACFEVGLNSLPMDAMAETTVSKEPSKDAHRGFELVALDEGEAVADVAVTLNIVKTNLENMTDLGEATICMKVGRNWVDRFGVDGIHILRFTEEGETQRLPTTFEGYEDGQAVFTAVSPDGLSVFGLTALIPIKPTINWIPIIGGAGGGSALVASLVYFILRRRSRSREARLRRRWPTGMRPEDWQP